MGPRAAHNRAMSAPHPGWRRTALVLLAFAALGALAHFVSPNIVGVDSFFYVGKARLIREVGLADRDFPWMQFSVIKDTGSSLWFAFAALMLPLSYLTDAALAIKLAGVMLTTFVLFACFWVVERARLGWAWFWPLLMFFAAPNVTAQLLMSRPQTATVGLSLLL